METRVEVEVTGMAGVLDANAPAGRLLIKQYDGDNTAELVLTGDDGSVARMHIGWQQATLILAHLGHAASAM